MVLVLISLGVFFWLRASLNLASLDIGFSLARVSGDEQSRLFSSFWSPTSGELNLEGVMSGAGGGSDFILMSEVRA